MNQNEIRLRKIIAAFTPFHYLEINMDREIKNNYVASEFKDNLASDICQAWVNVDCTEIHNALFSTLKTGNQLLTILNFVKL